MDPLLMAFVAGVTFLAVFGVAVTAGLAVCEWLDRRQARRAEDFGRRAA